MTITELREILDTMMNEAVDFTETCIDGGFSSTVEECCPYFANKHFKDKQITIEINIK